MTEIRSYRRVFDLERRVYSVDSLRLNPTGVPVRGIVYFGALVMAGLLIGRLPAIGELIGLAPWYLHDLALPAIAAAVLSVLRVEGRTFHLAARALLRYWAGPRRLEHLRRCAPPGQRWSPQALLLLPDGSEGRMRCLRYTGPGAMLVMREHERSEPRLRERGIGAGRGRSRLALTVRQRQGGQALERGKVVVLGRRAHVLIQPCADGQCGR